jgi:dTMP kinase
MAKNVGTAWLNQLYSHLFGNFAPDLTLLLDLSPSVGLLRADKRGNVAESRFEQMGHDYHERIRAGFLELASAHPARISVVDAAQSASDVHAAIIAAINTRFGLALAPAVSA